MYDSKDGMEGIVSIYLEWVCNLSDTDAIWMWYGSSAGLGYLLVVVVLGKEALEVALLVLFL